MARTSYDRLSAESADSLARETPRWYAHTATTLIFDAGPLATAEGGVDFEAIREAIEARIHRAPRYRQRLKWIPFENHPVWVDDRDFNLDYHLRHTSLPRPGGPEQLKRMSARIKAGRLERSRPLWECWVLEGLADGRFAVIVKNHHCMLGGAAGAELLEVLLSPDPADPIVPGPVFRPRPAPSAFELATEEVVRRARLPRRALRRLRAIGRDSESLSAVVTDRGRTLARMLGYSLRGADETPLSGRTGPHRCFDQLVSPLADARAIRSAFGASIHDVVLAAVTGAVRSFLMSRLVNPAALDFRVSMPMRTEEERPGRRVTKWVVDLPVWERDPAKRLEQIRAQTRRLAAATPIREARALSGETEWRATRLLTVGARSVSRRSENHLTLVNVPGPQQPLYLRGARLLEAYGQTPLAENHALSISVMSYDGKLCWGLNADFDRLHDLDRMASALASSLRELRSAAARRRGSLSVVGGASAP